LPEVAHATEGFAIFLSLCCMRVMPIKIITGRGGYVQMKAAFKMNWRHYMQEAFGLGIFMASACFFSAMLFSEKSAWYHFFPSFMARNIFMGLMMGLTALFIFYSPWTAPSGSQINPAVTLSFLRLGKMCRYDGLFFIIFQFIGGTVAVYLMRLLMGSVLTDTPVNSAVTIPGRFGVIWALITEFTIAFITMGMVLFTSDHSKLKKYTRIVAGCLVCTWVIVAGPISGFGMNPARTFASALPAHTWTAFWIYMIIPVAGMLTAAEFYLLVKKKKWNTKLKVVHRQYEINNNVQLQQNETDLKISTG
jgi:aquaporin Z